LKKRTRDRGALVVPLLVIAWAAFGGWWVLSLFF
jgi:hypothetical protein